MLILESNPNSMEAEAYKTIRTYIEYSSVRSRIKTLLITSPDSKDGRSTVCGNLGLAFSEYGKSVIILDCDFRKPSLHKLFNIPNNLGLIDIIKDPNKLEDAINYYNSNISIITSGTIQPNPSEILGSEKMDDLLKVLSGKYDIILLDSPPIGVVTDAQVLSTKTDGTIMVVMAEKTKSKRVIEAINLLKNVNVNIMGIVLNGVKSLDDIYMKYYKK